MLSLRYTSQTFIHLLHILIDIKDILIIVLNYRIVITLLQCLIQLLIFHIILMLLHRYIFHVNSVLSIPLRMLNRLLDWLVIEHYHVLYSFLRMSHKWILSRLVHVFDGILCRHIISITSIVDCPLYWHISSPDTNTRILNWYIIVSL